MSYDAIVIGAGHNGLTAAALLAKGGRSTLLVERRAVLGGLAASEEFHPGYRTNGVLHDTEGVRPWVVDALDLGRYGLSRHDQAPPTLIPQQDGAGLLLWRDPDKAAEELAAVSPGEADNYRHYRRFMDRLAPLVTRLADNPPPDIFEPGAGDILSLGRSALALRLLGKRQMMEILRVAPMALADWLDERFDSQLLQAALAGPAIQNTVTAPRSPGSTANLLRAECLAGSPIKGGPATLITALERAAKACGVEIRTDARVAGLVGEAGRISGVQLAGGEGIQAKTVVASCDPKHLFVELLPPALISRGLEHSISVFRSRGTAAKVHLALSGYPNFACRPNARVSSIRVGETLEELERAFDPIKYRKFSDLPILDIQVPTVESTDLAPEGHHVFSILVHFVPFELEGGWNDEARYNLYSRVLARLEEYAPGISELIVGHQVLTPQDLERRYGVTGGHLHHGEHALDQLLVRPTPECARYATPFEGLFLCGSGAHPGGGLTCAPGGLAARRILS